MLSGNIADEVFACTTCMSSEFVSSHLVSILMASTLHIYTLPRPSTHACPNSSREINHNAFVPLKHMQDISTSSVSNRKTFDISLCF